MIEAVAFNYDTTFWLGMLGVGMIFFDDWIDDKWPDQKVYKFGVHKFD